jgi:hypothetical protein
MAKRPIFIPQSSGDHFVLEKEIEFSWNPGFAPVQKKKNISALHQGAAEKGLSPLLEVSTKSDQLLGVKLSAFNLLIKLDNSEEIPIECAFQGSKLFENGGPFRDIYGKSTREAKRDERLKTSGSIIGFSFQGIDFPSEPKTAFYDWIYLKALLNALDNASELDQFTGFTDIEFNPQKSINCQAKSCALFVALRKRGKLEKAIESTESFLESIKTNANSPVQGELL